MTDPTIKRRDFLAASLAASCAAGAAALPAAAADPAPAAGGAAREYYELRHYHFRRGAMPKRADEYFREALIPALRRQGAGPVGVFNVLIGPDNPSAYVLIPHPSLEALAAMPGKLAGDDAYQKAGEAFLGAPATDPSYLGIDVTLLHAFEHAPKLEVPGRPAGEKPAPRIFELRTYRSHSESAGAKKIEMFDTRGEAAIFRRLGITPVFFAKGLIGAGLPSLTYMVTFPDLATREKSWKSFSGDPEWKTLSATPGFTDAEIVTSIANVVLAPAAYSEV